MSGATKCVIFGLVTATVGVALLTWCGVPYLAALLIVVIICSIGGFRYGVLDRG